MLFRSLVGSETLGVTGSAAAYTSANVGSYTVTVTYTLSNGSDGGLASNYSLANGTATGAVTARPLSISSPTIAAREYDGTSAAGTLSVGTLSNLADGETLNVTGSAANYSSANVGTYTVSISYTLGNGSGGGLASNYSLANGTASGEVTRRAVTITAGNKTKTYGDGDPALTFTVTTGSMVGSETLSGSLSRATGEDAGSYAITQGTVTSANNSNYSVSFVPGTLTINKATQTAVTLTSTGAIYGVALSLTSGGGSEIGRAHV
mgnify:CR=1 FL=1